MKTFEQLELLPSLLQALADESYSVPTPIQAQTIPVALTGRDILGCAQTGTGKTAAFALPILHLLGSSPRKAQPNRPIVLVLAPTRELAIQIEESFATYGRHLRLRTVLVYGGVSQGNQVRALNRGAHVLVATPGRLLDLMEQGHIELEKLEVFVLDEADRMLDMGFMPALKRIVAALPEKRQSLFFSATMPPKIVELTRQLLRNPFSVSIAPKATNAERIDQQVYFVERGQKLSLLMEILASTGVDRSIIFTRTKRGANALAEKLERSNVRSAVIHGNKSQNARQRALDAFRTDRVQVLVATDIAARGIDIDGVSHVINFELPSEPESYVHRIGRTGRAGAVGIALSLCSLAEMEQLQAIEAFLGKQLPTAKGEKRPLATAQNTSERQPRNGRRGAKSQSNTVESRQCNSAVSRTKRSPAFRSFQNSDSSVAVAPRSHASKRRPRRKPTSGSQHSKS